MYRVLYSNARLVRDNALLHMAALSGKVWASIAMSLYSASNCGIGARCRIVELMWLESYKHFTGQGIIFIFVQPFLKSWKYEKAYRVSLRGGRAGFVLPHPPFLNFQFISMQFSYFPKFLVINPWLPQIAPNYLKKPSPLYPRTCTLKIPMLS